MKSAYLDQYFPPFPSLPISVDLGSTEIRLPAIEEVGDPGTEIILGRDVLNRLRLMLDGPAGETTLLEP
jgi:hypothetical protein